MMKRRSLAILLTLFLLLGLTACGGSSSGGSAPSAMMNATADSAAAQNGYWKDSVEAPKEMEARSEALGGSQDSRSALPDGVKMIYRADLELETTEFERADGEIKALTRQLGGYFEEQSTRTRSGGYRSASYTVRVPAARFEEFLEQIGNVCTVSYQTQSAEDVSEFYYDTESRLETAKIKLDRLQELLSRAEEMADIITLEDAISETEYQIESLSGTLRHYDALIGYSTINVSLNEVYRVTEIETAPLTFGERMGAAFREGLRDFTSSAEDFAEWLAYSWLSLLVFIAVVVLIVKLVARARAKRASGVKKENRGLFHKKNKTAPSPETEHSEETKE